MKILSIDKERGEEKIMYKTITDNNGRGTNCHALHSPLRYCQISVVGTFIFLLGLMIEPDSATV